MKLHELKPNPGSTRKSKRVGRGYGSGKGKTSGKGMDGQKSRSGPGPYRTFEGGQNRLVKRMPFKRGFNNIWRIDYQVINVADLNEWSGQGAITPEALLEARVIRRKRQPVKILGDGELTVALEVHAHKFSSSARQKIEAAGGRVVELPWVVERPSRSRGANPSMRQRNAESS
ncbi:MAG: 50S ribosomal protein L15 [Chloroflexaceae bacterium]|nr:50S ribosomal protein L15 [Chloroflexaceae bacterium]